MFCDKGEMTFCLCCSKSCYKKSKLKQTAYFLFASVIISLCQKFLCVERDYFIAILSISRKLSKYIANMAHWFHRNPLKATAPTNFEIKMIVQDVEALKVLR